MSKNLDGFLKNTLNEEAAGKMDFDEFIEKHGVEGANKMAPFGVTEKNVGDCIVSSITDDHFLTDGVDSDGRDYTGQEHPISAAKYFKVSVSKKERDSIMSAVEKTMDEAGGVE